MCEGRQEGAGELTEKSLLLWLCQAFESRVRCCVSKAYSSAFRVGWTWRGLATPRYLGLSSVAELLPQREWMRCFRPGAELRVAAAGRGAFEARR